MDILREIQGRKDETIRIRRQIHRHPELSWNEYETTQFVINELIENGIDFVRPTQTGVIATIHGNGDGKTLGLRADMDALPIQEENEIPYKSENPGVMHACGHDVHTTALLQTAKILNAHRDAFRGDIKLIFQPSEEALPSGAEAMVKSGYLADCSAIIGFHVQPDLKVGKICATAGPKMAASAAVDITITGATGHGGNPSTAIDATVAAAAVVMNLQTLVSRELSLDNMAVLSIGTLHSGISRTIISGEATLSGTFRYYTQEALEHATEAIRRICTCTAEAYRAAATVEVKPTGGEAVINDAVLAAMAQKSLSELYGPQVLSDYPLKGINEDFSYYDKICPILFLHIGAENDTLFTPHPLHNSEFKVDEDVLDYAIGAYVKFALDYLNA